MPLAALTRLNRVRSHVIRASAWTLICLLAWPPQSARAQLLPPLNQLLNPVTQLLDGVPLLSSLLDPVLDPLLDGLGGATVPNEYKLDAALRVWSRSGSTTNRRVIVTVAPGKLPLVSTLLAVVGGVLNKTLPGVNALVADVSQLVLGLLALDPNVLAISIDGPVLAVDGNLVAASGGSPDTAAPLRATLGLGTTTPAATGVGVAIVDSGIAPSVDFTGRISAFYDFTSNGQATAPVDPYGHGTHVAGIIGSSGASSANSRYRGVGGNARLIGLRVLDANGAGETSRVIQAIEFATNNRALLGIHVLNLSLGHPIYEPAATDPLVRAIERAVDAGIVVVVAAGNYGYNRDLGRSGYAGITSPGNAPSAITIGAGRTAGTVDRLDDDVAPYSSRGPSWYDGFAKPDLIAPGDGIVSNGWSNSALYESYPSVRVDGSHMRLNGTSMAAAAASGAAALMIEAHRSTHLLGPALKPNTIKAILQYTATPLGNGQDGLMQGAGAINVPGAIAAARAIDASRPIGADWLSGSLSPTSTYDNVSWAWAREVTWRDTLIGSTGSLIDLHRASWSTLNWGQTTQWEADVVPGANLVWDPGIDWAANAVWGGQTVGTANSDGQTFVWGYVDGPDSTVWTNLASQPTGDQTFVWGYTDVPTPP